MKLHAGKFEAVARDISVRPGKSAIVLMLVILWKITRPGYENETIAGYHCLRQKNGALSAILLQKLRECFAWNGANIVWFNEPANFAQKECRLTLDYETFEGKTRLKIIHFDPLGGPANKNVDLNLLDQQLRAWAEAQPPANTIAPIAAPANGTLLIAPSPAETQLEDGNPF